MKKSFLITAITALCWTGSLSAEPVKPDEAKQMLQAIMEADSITANIVERVGSLDIMLQQMDIREKDLNGDNQPEFIATVKGGVCGTLGNCPTAVFRKSGQTFTLLLYTLARELQPLTTAHQGYIDFRSNSGNGADEGLYILYSYRAGKYYEDKCVRLIYGQTHTIEQPLPCEEVEAR